MNLLETIIMSIYDIGALVLISKKLAGVQLTLRKGILVFVIVAVLGGGIGYYITNEMVGALFHSVVSCLMIQILYKRKFFETILIYLFSFVLIMAIQLIILTIIKSLYTEFKYDVFHGIIAQSLMIFFVLFIYYKLPFESILNFIISKNRIFRVVVISFFAISISVLVYLNIDFNEAVKNDLLFIAISLTIFYATFSILKSGLINSANEKELLMYKTYNPIIEELIDDIRARQHEFDNHIQVLSMMVGSGDTEISNADPMGKYITNLNSNRKMGDLIKLQDKILASLIYSKLRMAEESNAIFNINIKNHEIITILKEYEVLEIFGILIDNALETKAENNIINLTIDRVHEMNVIEVQNRHEYLTQDTIEKMFDKGFSTKNGSNRGYGLYNLKKIVLSAKGELEIENKLLNADNYISIKVRFN